MILAYSQTGTSFLYLSTFDHDAIKQRCIIKIYITKPQKKKKYDHFWTMNTLGCQGMVSELVYVVGSFNNKISFNLIFFF